MGNEMLQCQNQPQPLDKMLNENVIKYLKKHIEALEEREKEVRKITSELITTNYSKGVIDGLRFAINLLNDSVKNLKSK